MFPSDLHLANGAMLSIELPPGCMMLRHIPVLRWVMLCVCLCLGLGGVAHLVATGDPRGLWGVAGLVLALLLATSAELQECKLDRSDGTITFERWGPRGHGRHVRWLADLTAVRVKVVGRGGCDVWLSFKTGEPVRLLGNSLGTKGVDVAREIHGFVKLEAPVQVEN